MKVDVYNSKGSKTDKSVTLNKAVFGIEPNDHAIYLDVKRYRAAQRQGTHDTLHRGLVSGSTRKIKKQKGTGTARAGSIKNPLFRGGGTTFGPEPRDYTQKLNHKVKQLARRSALELQGEGESHYGSRRRKDGCTEDQGFRWNVERIEARRLQNAHGVAVSQRVCIHEQPKPCQAPGNGSQ